MSVILHILTDFSTFTWYGRRGAGQIIAMNSGRPMSPKLMYEFPRAAMNVELKRGRGAVTKFLDATYGATHWTRSAVHD
jgi:hypothetical protein